MNLTQRENLTRKIREDYGTVVRFAKLHDMPASSIYSAICGRIEHAAVVRLLVEKGYIQSADDLRKVA